jgi:hypothetical protein
VTVKTVRLLTQIKFFRVNTDKGYSGVPLQTLGLYPLKSNTKKAPKGAC